MKKGILLIAIMFAALFGSVSQAPAQVHVRFNVGVQPLWGPTGYDYVQYYYIPDIDAYYDVNNQVYVYNDNGAWVTSAYLPPAYGNFDLYRSHKVVINADRPWLRDDYYRDHYAYFRGRYDQPIIRDSRDQRYWANPEHPMHGRWNGGYERHGEWGGYRGRGEWGGYRGHGEGGGYRGHGEGRGHEEHEEHEHGRR